MELIPKDLEAERLENLESYHIIDSEPEASFDQLTMLAARVCGTPIALLSFIDQDRQWFKSTFGVNILELPRYITACNKTIDQKGLHVIPDASDVSCSYSEYMMSLGFRFYAGVPIISPAGHAIGSLCVIDKISRDLSREQLQTLKAIADQVLENLELRKKYRENLERLRDLGEKSLSRDKKLADLTQKKVHQSLAEMASGLDFRMRSFLVNIQSNASLLEGKIFSREDVACLQSIQESADSLVTILNGLEKFVTAEKEKWMKLVELNSVIKEVLSFLAHKLQEHRIHVTTDLGPELRCLGNYAKLVEVFYSVLNNAVEAIDDREGGTIEILVKEENQKAIIDVKDNGAGVEENISAFIFQPFFTTKNYPGSGLGLTLAQSHLEEHGGGIELVHRSAPTIFRIVIPVPSGANSS
jgi:two-component system NtrC family sensor kinase